MIEALGRGLVLPDPWQLEAVGHLREGSDVVLDAPTGAGKTLVFEQFLGPAGRGKGGQAVYTVPTRALAHDKLSEWRGRGWDVGIATGELAENTGAPVLVATLETQIDGLLAGRGPALLVIDEYQMLDHTTRGAAYGVALASVPEGSQLLLMSGSVGNAGDVAAWLCGLGRRARLVATRERPVPLEPMAEAGIPARVPRGVTGFWAGLVARASLAGLTPLLIFAPVRSTAEKIARQVAQGWPALRGLRLDADQRAQCGKELAGLLEQRVAYHHSGLPYAVRAGVIEPLAKAGELACVVATTGLAAGINFSVRSVCVAGLSYWDGRHERRLTPDELLQMYGRAGRRGLDEVGHVIEVREGAGLNDAAAARLRGPGAPGWAPMLRAMWLAAGQGEGALAAAARLAGRIYGGARVRLGLPGEEGVAGVAGVAEGDDGQVRGALFGLGAVTREVRAKDGRWERYREEREGERALGDLSAWGRGRWRPAVAVASAVEAARPGLGRLCKLAGEDGVRYGEEIVVARRGRDGSGWLITKAMRRAVGWRGGGLGELREVEDRWVLPWLERWPGVMLESLAEEGGLLVLRIDVSGIAVRCYEDLSGAALWGVERRDREEAPELEIDGGEGWGVFVPPRGSVLRAWRRLGLVDRAGVPTARGRVVGAFQHAEGLGVAAALEDESYPIDEIVWHVANLRGGARFEDLEGGGSERLAACCRETYGLVEYEGYLDQGLPTGYAEGAAEALAARKGGAKGGGSAGDLERARQEWMGLLRRAAGVGGMDGVPRWEEFRAAARSMVGR